MIISHARQRVKIDIIPPVDPHELACLLGPEPQCESRARHRGTQGRQVGAGETDVDLRRHRELKRTCQVGQEQHPHPISQPRLLTHQTVSADDQERACVKKGRQRNQPRLSIVLGAVKAEHGMREMALQDIGQPSLALAQMAAQHLGMIGPRVTPQQANRVGRTARA